MFYHFNKWSTDGSWETMLQSLLKECKKHLDLSCVQLDGSQTRANRGGQVVGIQHRKSEEITNFLYLCDNQAILLGISEPISGNNHDLSNFKVHFEKLLSWLETSEISVDGLFLNADAGFD